MECTKVRTFLTPWVEVAGEYNIQPTKRFLREELTRLGIQGVSHRLID